MGNLGVKCTERVGKRIVGDTETSLYFRVRIRSSTLRLLRAYDLG